MFYTFRDESDHSSLKFSSYVEYGGSSSSVGTNNQAKVLEDLYTSIENIVINFEKNNV